MNEFAEPNSKLWFEKKLEFAVVAISDDCLKIRIRNIKDTFNN